MKKQAPMNPGVNKTKVTTGFHHGTVMFMNWKYAFKNWLRAITNMMIPVITIPDLIGKQKQHLTPSVSSLEHWQRQQQQSDLTGP